MEINEKGTRRKKRTLRSRKRKNMGKRGARRARPRVGRISRMEGGRGRGGSGDTRHSTQLKPARLRRVAAVRGWEKEIDARRREYSASAIANHMIFYFSCFALNRARRVYESRERWLKSAGRTVLIY